MTSNLYKQIKVISRENGWLHIYICLKRLVDRKYAVHQKEYLPIRSSIDRDIIDIETEFNKLFLEENPDTRCVWFSSLEEAITDHNSEFGNLNE